MAFFPDESQLPPHHEPLLVAVSGGRDSVALLHWLQAGGRNVAGVLHVNHQLRGEASHGDEAFVRDLVKRAKLPGYFGRSKVAAMAAERSISIELAARHARHEFFASVARETGCAEIVLGHHADDQVETVLQRLFRGTGSAGMAGMRLRSRLTVGAADAQALCLHRPFLTVWRSEIDEYVQANELSYREDESNASGKHLRNRIRHELIPLASDCFGRDIRAAVLRYARIVHNEALILQSAASRAFAAVCLSADDGWDLSVEELAQLDPPELQVLAIREWLTLLKIGEVNEEICVRISSMLDFKNGPAKVNVSSGGHVRRKTGRIFFEAKKDNGPQSVSGSKKPREEGCERAQTESNSAAV